MTLSPMSIPANFSHDAVDEYHNNTDSILCHFELSSWVPFVTGVYILIISVLGIILNVFVLVVFWLHKKACTVAEIYLSNLAAADLFLMSVPSVLAVTAATVDDWQFTDTLCKVLMFFPRMNADCSIYILALVSFDRYVALVHPLTDGRMRRPLYAKLACVMVWGVCFLLNVPTFIYSEATRDPEGNFTTCVLKDPIPTMYLVFKGVNEFCCIVLIAVISFCTVNIIHTLRNRIKNRLNTQKKEQKATTLVLVVLLVFMICWVPMQVVRILDLLSLLKILNGCHFLKNLHLCYFIFTSLVLSNSVLNPILYVIVGKTFQTKVKESFTQMSTTLSISQ
ncbi:B2 bradykinin receptor-like [Acanthochromis polyacanthus]|uniref:Bradykinin receptor B2 n=1 Tax=Acanthochromis polyacanthus TaxID=80966 RepID=A0A3Q1EN31_9TELE|nr:B2 bradykinin receptor-like [Acanthochromis polyacanthus]